MTAPTLDQLRHLAALEAMQGHDEAVRVLDRLEARFKREQAMQRVHARERIEFVTTNLYAPVNQEDEE